MKLKLSAVIGTRVTKTLRTAFVKKAKKEEGMDQSEVLRHLIQAYVDGRINFQLGEPK